MIWVACNSSGLGGLPWRHISHTFLPSLHASLRISLPLAPGNGHPMPSPTQQNLLKKSAAAIHLACFKGSLLPLPSLESHFIQVECPLACLHLSENVPPLLSDNSGASPPPPHLLIQPSLSLQNGALHTLADSLHNSLNFQQQSSSTASCASVPSALPATKPVESSLRWAAQPRAV